jgi:hypothetical protein
MNYRIEGNVVLSQAFKNLRIDDGKLYFLPENLSIANQASDFIYSEASTDLKKVFRQEGITIDYLTNNLPALRLRKTADWWGPSIFIGVSFLSENSNLIGVALNLMSSYLYDFFKGHTQNKKVKFHIVVETKKQEYQKISYEGSIEGVKELESLIKQLKK